MLGWEMFGLKPFTLTQIGICVRNTGKQIYKSVLTAHTDGLRASPPYRRVETLTRMAPDAFWERQWDSWRHFYRC